VANTVFYAWQSDRNQKVCRYFIRDAIDRACQAIKKELAIEDSPQADEATKGVPGTPHIAETIFDKIRSAGMFVGDLTFVGATELNDGAQRKLVPNPNVLIELGQASASIGWNRIILVMNTAFGSPQELPFDLRHRSFPIQYEFADSTQGEKNQIRDALANELKRRIGQVIESRVIERAEEAKKVVGVELNRFQIEYGNGTHQLLSITAVNRGQRPVTIDFAEIVLSDGQTFPAVSNPMFVEEHWDIPKRLAETDKVVVYFKVAPLRTAMAVARASGKPISFVRGVVRDTLGNSFTSEAYGINEEDLATVINPQGNI
jgi:hypothetical protein